MSHSAETIFALSSGLGKSAIAVVRVSGPMSEIILESVCKRKNLPTRQVVYTGIYDDLGRLLDKAVVLFFRGPYSFTGEDIVEFQVTGGRATSGALLQALSKFPTTRPADAGEFARRAFENGKIDLVEVEGLAAAIEAETVAQLRHSAFMAFGAVSVQCERARTQLLKASAIVESMLDFSDVEDPDGATIDEAFRDLEGAKAALQSLLQNGRVTERLRDGFAVAIIGSPNSGKSTLINKVLARDAVIVSDIPGTTRDYLEFFVEVAGFPLIFIDTAGFRIATDPIERMGIERSHHRIRAVDLIVWLSPDEHDATDFIPPGIPTIKVRSKSDLCPPRSTGGSRLSISAHSGQGLDELISEIVFHAGAFFRDAGSPGLATVRQRNAATSAVDAIERALASSNRNEEFIAEDIRLALSWVGRVTGRVDVEDVLDEIFSRLCVGK